MPRKPTRPSTRLTRQQLIGRRVRLRRVALGWTQRELAQQSHMPQEHVSHLERGNFVAVNPERLVALADALQTTTDYLLGRAKDPGPVEDEEALVAVGMG